MGCFPTERASTNFLKRDASILLAKKNHAYDLLDNKVNYAPHPTPRSSLPAS
jgi:hypothetical protein